MMTILVPVDGSRPSMRALAHAVKQARYAPITLHLLTVEPPLDDYGMVGAYISPQQHARAMKTRAAGILQQAAARARGRNVTTQSHVIIGDVATSIARAAGRLKCDSIVMGTRGMGPLKDLMLGSVASKVLHLSRVPVTLVK